MAVTVRYGNLEVGGLKEWQERMRAIADADPLLRAVAGVFVTEAERVMTKSKLLVPFDTGNLEGTGGVFPPRIEGDAVTVDMGYGTEYALVQHERLDFEHADGRQAKYLEEPALEAIPEIREALTEVVTLEVRKMGE